MVTMIISSPGISQNEIADRLGYSASWVSTVIATDAFQAKLAEKREEIVDPIMRASAEEQARGLYFRSMEILREKLRAQPEQIPDQLALQTFSLSARALGYGAREQPPAAVQVNVEQHLNVLGENLTQLLRRKSAQLQETIDGEVERIGPSDDTPREQASG
jgi:DNA-binding MarR family transcriptional regulator